MKSLGLLVAGFVAGFVTLFVLMLIFGDYEDNPAPQVVAAASGPTFDAVCGANTNDMTDPQIAAYAEQWIGQRFSGWSGWVYDVTARADGTYNLEIAMEPRGLFWSRNIVIENIPNDWAARMNVEQPITFSGRITRNDTFLEGVCNPLVITDVTLQE